MYTRKGKWVQNGGQVYDAQLLSITFITHVKTCRHVERCDYVGLGKLILHLSELELLLQKLFQQIQIVNSNTVKMKNIHSGGDG